MGILHPSIFFVHFKTFFKIIYLNCFKHFSIRRFLFTLLFLILFTLIGILLFVTRLLDEILFFGYRKVDVSKPVFIISNPRSGTTYLHRLMCLDEERYSYTLLYHTIFNSITLMKFIDGVGWIDRRIGRPFRKLFDWIDSKVFKGWDDIHPTGMNQSEEDEGFYIFPLITSAICLICPFMEEFPYLTLPDKMDEKSRRRLQKYFKSSMQRFVYATGKDKMVLSKNVISIGRIKTLLELFPEAKVVYLIRDPRKAVPSFISMFRAPWTLHSPELALTGKEHQALGHIAMDYYAYFHKIKDELNNDHLMVVQYTDLVANPKQTVYDIYEKFNLDVSPAFEKRLEAETSKQRTYRSKHSYSLEQYGLSEKDLMDKLEEVMIHYGFSVSA